MWCLVTDVDLSGVCNGLWRSPVGGAVGGWEGIQKLGMLEEASPL